MDRVEDESFGLDCPAFADEFVRCEAFQRLQSSAEVVSADKVVEMRCQLLVRFVEIAADGRFLDGSVHAFDLAVGPWMARFRQPMIDVQDGARILEGMGTEEFAAAHEFFYLGRGPGRTARIGEMRAVIGQNRVDLVGDRRGQPTQEIGSDPPGRSAM